MGRKRKHNNADDSILSLHLSLWYKCSVFLLGSLLGHKDDSGGYIGCYHIQSTAGLLLDLRCDEKCQSIVHTRWSFDFLFDSTDNSCSSSGFILLLSSHLTSLSNQHQSYACESILLVESKTENCCCPLSWNPFDTSPYNDKRCCLIFSWSA